MKIHVRNVRITIRLPDGTPCDAEAVERWNANAWTRSTKNDMGYEVEMLSFPGRETKQVATAVEAMHVSLAFLRKKE